MLRIYRLPDAALTADQTEGYDYPWQVDGFNTKTGQVSSWVHNYVKFEHAVADLADLYAEYVTEPAARDAAEWAAATSKADCA